MKPPPSLRQRPLLSGRGRVYMLRSLGLWYADYRAPDGTISCDFEETLAEAHDWIRTKAKEATK